MKTKLVLSVLIGCIEFHGASSAFAQCADNWAKRAPLPVPQNGMTSAVVNGKIYVIGGYNGTQNNNQIYDPAHDSWTTGAALPVPQADMTSAVYEGKIYVCGGAVR